MNAPRPTHTIDPYMDYCMKCGASGAAILSRKLACTSADNVTGISHKARARRVRDGRERARRKSEEAPR